MKFAFKTPCKKVDYRAAYLKRRPGYESREEQEGHDMFTGDMTTDAVDFSKVMPDANLKGIFAEPSEITSIGTQQGSGAKQLVEKVIGGFMRIANTWFLWRPDDNCVTYIIRVLLGCVLAVYVFYILYKKHLDRYLFQIRHTLAYTLELDM